MYWKFHNLIDFYIYTKHISLRQFVYADFNVHQCALSASNRIRYHNLLYFPILESLVALIESRFNQKDIYTNQTFIDYKYIKYSIRDNQKFNYDNHISDLYINMIRKISGMINIHSIYYTSYWYNRNIFLRTCNVLLDLNVVRDKELGNFWYWGVRGNDLTNRQFSSWLRQPFAFLVEWHSLRTDISVAFYVCVHAYASISVSGSIQK